MTGLINNKVDEIVKKDVQSLQNIVDKFASVLQLIKPESQIPYIAFIIDKCVTHLNENHKDQNPNWKSWSVVVVKHLYEKDKIKKETDIISIIDEFLSFKEDGYKKYCDNIVAVTEYDRDRGFVYTFIRKKINK